MPPTDNNQKMLTDIVGIIEQAGRKIILPGFESTLGSSIKADGSVVTDIDMACQQFIADRLAEINPQISFLGEEMEPSEQLACLNQDGERFWCLDPLDGTTNFVASIPIFGISLALIEHGVPVLACIHDPVRQETFTAIHRHGAHMNGNSIQSATETELPAASGYIDFKRLSVEYKQQMIIPDTYRSQRNIGTCALEWAWLAAGRGHFIIHGGEKIWDFAAGSLIASEAGCRVGDFSGTALFPRHSLSSSILATCNAEIHTQLSAFLQC